MSDPSSTTEVMQETGLPPNTAENKDNGISGGESEGEKPSEEVSQYVTGVKLYAVIAGLTMVAFLMMLDSTIVTTVGCAFTLFGVR
jgi:hypothetical protein